MAMTERAKEAKKAYKRDWDAKNRERIRAYHKKWRADNKDKIKEYQAAYWDKKAAEAAGDPVE